MCDQQPNYLSSRLRRLQAETRKEYEASGREKIDEPKIVAAAAVYAEDQATHHSSGYQSNDSAPEESNEEPTNDSQSDLVCSQVGNNLHSMTLEDFDRPWHEEVDEYLSAEHASHAANTPTLCNGHDDSAISAPWAQQNARNIPLENCQNVAEPSDADHVSWPRCQSQPQEDETVANEWPCRTQSPHEPNAYRLFQESASVFHDADQNATQHVDHRQWQPPPAAQYTFQDRHQFDEQPTDSHQWMAQSADHRDKQQPWTSCTPCANNLPYEPQQWAQPAQSVDQQPLEQHPYINECGQADWRQHSDDRRRTSYPEPAHEAPVYLLRENAPWPNADTNFDDLATNADNPATQFISPRVVSVAAALSSINSTSGNHATNDYLAQASPMRSASYDNATSQYNELAAKYQNHLLKIVEPSSPSDSSETYNRLSASCINRDIGYDNQLFCEPDSKQYYLIIDKPPSPSEVDVSKPPPPLPSILNNGGSVSTVANPGNTEVVFVHQTHARHPQQPSTLVRPQALYGESPTLQQSQPRATVDVQRYASQQPEQASQYSFYPLRPLEVIPCENVPNSDIGCWGSSPSDTSHALQSPQTYAHAPQSQASQYSSDLAYPQRPPNMIPCEKALNSDMGYWGSPPSDDLHAPKSPQTYANAPQSNIDYWSTPLPHSPPQGVTPDMLYSEVTAQKKMTYGQPSSFDCETSADQFAMQRASFESSDREYNRQPPFNPRFEPSHDRQPSVNAVDGFRRQSSAKSRSSPSCAAAPAKQSQSASTAQTSHSFRTSSPTEIRGLSKATTPAAPESAHTTPTNHDSGMRRDGQRWARNSNQSAQNTSTNASNGMRRDAKRGSNSRSDFESTQTARGARWDAQRGSNSKNGNDGGYSTPQDRRQRQSGGRFSGGSGGPTGGNRTMKRASYTPEEVDQLSASLEHSYGMNLDALMDRCFSKENSFAVSCNLRSNRHGVDGADMFSSPLWPNQACAELAQLKDRLNGVKERLSSYDLNDWHRHTRTTNPADMVMRRLRSDVKVEFLTQAWCKFYELVNHFNLIPPDARRSNELRSIHLCEAPGAFVASLNHYLRLNHPQMQWRWKANSLNPFYEGNHLSSMINDDRFMLQTIENWDFGPDMTGDIMHPGYPDHLRQVWGDGQLAHLVTADGSFDCQDKPEEQEKLVSWLHLKEALTAIRVLRKGGHFVIKMFTFFECESVCLLFLLQCVFTSLHVMKPATSKEGNSEVYVVCREFKDDPSFEPFIRRLLEVDQETFSKFAMFPLERIPRPFLRSVESCAGQFADYQSDVIERNIRLYQHERYDEFRRHFEFVQEKLFEEYVSRYGVKPIPLEQTVVRMPQRRNENRFTLKVLEQRERKQGSHDDQLKRSSLGKKDLVKVVADELAAFPTHQLHSKVSTAPKVELQLQDFRIRAGKPIHTITSSQFCHGMLIRVRNELMNTLNDLKQYYIAAAEMEKSLEMENNPKRYPNLCDFAKTLMMMKTYNDTQREIFGMLYDRLATLEKNEHLTLFCFPLLTQFNISVLCILNQIFEEINFEPPNIVYLRKRDTKNFEVWMPKLQEISRAYTSEKAVISFLPIRKITGSSNPFYSWIIEANNSQIIREIQLFSSYNS